MQGSADLVLRETGSARRWSCPINLGRRRWRRSSTRPSPGHLRSPGLFASRWSPPAPANSAYHRLVGRPAGPGGRAANPARPRRSIAPAASAAAAEHDGARPLGIAAADGLDARRRRNLDAAPSDRRSRRRRRRARRAAGILLPRPQRRRQTRRRRAPGIDRPIRPCSPPPRSSTRWVVSRTLPMRIEGDATRVRNALLRVRARRAARGA